MHGLAGSSRWWRGVESRLHGLDLDAVDLPRVGDLDALERWLVERLEPRSSLVGHSLGGLLAARVAARRPDLVDRLGLIAPAGIPGRSLLGHALPLAGALAAVRPGFAPLLLHDGVRSGPRALLSAARAVVAADIRDELPAIRAPTLIVWGEDDRLVPSRQAEAWKAALPGARVVLLPRTGHVPMVERPDEVSALLRELLHEAS